MDDNFKIRVQLSAWYNRAAMAYQMYYDELSEQALQMRWEYQRQLAEFEGKSFDEVPRSAKEVFGYMKRGDPPSGPKLQSAYVPIRPYPVSGAGSIALPIPDEDSSSAEA